MKKLVKKSSVDQELLRKLPKISLLIGIVLLVLKYYAYVLTHSLTIYSDALESIVNVVMALITIFVIWYSSLPADEDHPYGHGKVESVAASFEGGAIAFAGLVILLDAFSNLFSLQHEVKDIDLGAFIVFIAGFINGGYGIWLLKKGKELHSETLKANGHHLISDMITSIGVLLGLLMVKLTEYQKLDSFLALFYGGYLSFNGIKIFLGSINVLVDGQDKSLIEKLANLFEENYRPGVIHIHFTRIIRSGRHHHIDCHMVIPEFWSIEKAHEFSDQFEEQILSKYETEGEFHIHLDPCRKKYCDSCEYEPCTVRLKPFSAREKFHYDELIRSEEAK